MYADGTTASYIDLTSGRVFRPASTGYDLGSSAYHGNMYTDTVYNVVTVSNAAGNIYIKPTAFSGATQDEFKAWLADNPFTVVYVLAEPVETPLTESELAAYRALHTNRLNTTIYADDNAGLSVEYAADTKKYIDKKFTELRDAVLSMGGNV